MTLTLIVGGARSGKSRLAVTLAKEHGGAVTFLATGEARDDEMRERIARHRRERPSSWLTVEEPQQLEAAIADVDTAACLIVDCLSLWLSNGLEDRTDDDLRDEARAAAITAHAREGLTLAVSNEVGLGLVPTTALGRRYRDLLGEVNAIWAARADHACLVVAGRALRLEPVPDLRELVS